MSTEEPMAVVAPDLESGPAAHVPEVEEGQSSDDDMPLAKANGSGANGNKRAPETNGEGSSSEDEKPLVCPGIGLRQLCS
jgi:hypothetical protein